MPLSIRLDGVHCSACGANGTVASDDPEADRLAWPEVACFFTLDCEGEVQPDALN